MTIPVSLGQRLAEALPSNLRLRAYHLSTPPTACEPIFSSPPSQADRATFCESHFLGIASAPDADHSHSSVFIFAIEILIFTTESLTTVFVSKADTSGFLAELNLRPGAPSLTRTLLEVFLDYLLKPRLDADDRVVLSLFARSQNQYLFPGSIENPGKHVLDDRQLIKWWCGVLDRIWRPLDHEVGDQGSHQIGAYVVVPGCDKGETRAFFPPSSKQDPASAPRWINAYPIELIAPNDSLALRSCIPRLPDDPKCRFLDDLDGDYIGPEGQWRSIKTLDQFWEMMSYRQECSAGRLVGFVWITFTKTSQNRHNQDESQTEINSSFLSETSANGILPTPAQSQICSSHVTTTEAPASEVSNTPALPQTPPPSSPVLQPAMVTTGSQARAANPIEDHLPISNNLSFAPFWSPSSQGQIIVSAENYSTLIDFLLELDFAGKSTAAESTQKFVNKAMEYATPDASQHAEMESRKPCFGLEIIGQGKINTGNSSMESRPEEANHAPQVNLLSGIRKKRKVDTSVVAENAVRQEVTSGQPNLLSSSIVRKKAKMSE